MTDKNIGKKTLKNIKDQNIKPRPKWEFMLKNYFIWLLSFLSLSVGGISFAMVLYMMNYSYDDVYVRAGMSAWNQIWLILPYFWVVLLLLFVFLIFYNFKHIDKGYKFRIPFILSMSVVGSIVLGLAFYGMNIGGIVDKGMAYHVPGYGSMCNCRRKQQLWLRPQEGFLAGIIRQDKRKGFDLSALNGKIWFVNTREAQIKPPVKIKKGEPVKIIGEKTKFEYFRAREVRRGAFSCMMRHNSNSGLKKGADASSCPIMENGSKDSCGHQNSMK